MALKVYLFSQGNMLPDPATPNNINPTRSTILLQIQSPLPNNNIQSSLCKFYFIISLGGGGGSEKKSLQWGGVRKFTMIINYKMPQAHCTQ